MKEKLQAFADLVERHGLAQLVLSGVNCEANQINTKSHIRPGRKFTKVDRGSSGKFMVDNATGEIFGIKAYGQVHRGHCYGTLDTIADWYWGRYYPERWDIVEVQSDAAAIRMEIEKTSLDHHHQCAATAGGAA